MKGYQVLRQAAASARLSYEKREETHANDRRPLVFLCWRFALLRPFRLCRRGRGRQWPKNLGRTSVPSQAAGKYPEVIASIL